jgi:hypothetical protein
MESEMNQVPFLLVALLPGIAVAQGLALTGKGGTTGLGLELTSRLTDTANLRFGVNGYNLYSDRTESGVDYDGRFRLRSASLIGDLFPIQDSIFRLSAGVFYNDNRLDMTAKPRGGSTYEINGTIYPAATIGTLTGQLTFKKGAPYLGVGWGNAFAKPYGWNFVLDVGAMYQSRPKFRLTTDSTVCNAACQADIAAEQADAEADLRSFRWYPVVTAGAAYRF